jgi:hypothetical protein
MAMEKQALSEGRVFAAVALFAVLVVVRARGQTPQTPDTPPTVAPDPAATRSLPPSDPHLASPAKSGLVLPGPSDRENPLPRPDALGDAFSPVTAGPANFSGPFTGQPPVLATYRVLWIPDQPVRGQATDLSLVRQDFTFTAPTWHDATNELTWSARLRSEILHEDAVFPVSGVRLPPDLWNVGLGGAYRHRFDNDWVAGAGVQVGSASDKPFHGWDEMNVGVSAFLRLPQGDRNAWVFTLAYSPTAQLPIPIPGVAYVWVPSDQLRMNIGVPFQVTYRPADDLTLSLSYMLLTTVHARMTYRWWGPLRLYVGYDWENEAYLPADRPDRRDRLVSYDMRLSGGLQAGPGGHWLLDLSGGYVFDRFYAYGNSSALNSPDRIDVGAGPFLALSCGLRW